MTENKKTESKEIESGWIRELAAILQETGLTEIEIERAGVRLKVSRAASAAPAPIIAHSPSPASGPAPVPALETPSPAASAQNHPGAVPSPMVGTAYLAPSPGADPFVKQGDTISAGQTLMIIEAMKTMNPIAAPRAGVVKSILVADAQPVEFGEPLVIIE
ncbi:MAG: acetyl-CoA carboxylase biotin carboxyl carrier protein [Alphaproteobacteria bacterium]|nr:acetyl-CoA carboxylase biotin carboxyl carrier protein [Alphaproteobacteria bacterium]